MSVDVDADAKTRNKGLIVLGKELLESEAILPSTEDINNICRLCANSNDKVVGIYSEQGVFNELSIKMNRYLPIKVTEDDTLPLHCCWNCVSTVLAWHELVVISVETDRRLRSLIDVDDNKTGNVPNCESIEETNVPVQDDRFDLRSPASGLNVFCQESSLGAVHPKGMLIPKQKKNINTKKQYLVHCNVIADESLMNYLENIQNPLPETTVTGVYTSPDPSDCSELITSYPLKDQCEITENSCKSESLVNYNIDETKMFDAESTHIYDNPDIKTKEYVYENPDIKTKEYNFECQYCSLMFINEEDILQHMKNEHANKHLKKTKVSATSAKKKLRCKKLDQNIINTAKTVIAGRVYYTCKICRKILHSPYTYIWHIRIHTGERPFVCDLCGKQFRISQGLVRHVKETHEGVKKFGCDICGRMFATRRNVQEHRRIHTNERPYVCDLCGKSFKQKASLFVHNRSHSDSYPFTCSYCNQGFRTRPPLLIHMTRHTGEKPYPCDICGRFFRIKYELKRHKLIHSEEKPFKCEECGLHFRQKRYLKNHNKTNHKDVQVKCNTVHN